jgi:hypothetical protein
MLAIAGETRADPSLTAVRLLTLRRGNRTLAVNLLTVAKGSPLSVRLTPAVGVAV